MNNKSRSNYSKPVSRPVVSVVIPVFNGATYLNEAVTSVQKSTYRKFEIILVDDGSTDESHAICRRLARTYKRVRFYSLPKNRGMSHALNFALTKTRGEYICRLNQDDLMLPHRIEKQIAFLAKHPEVVAVGSSILLLNDDGFRERLTFPQTDEDIRKLWLMLSPFSDPAVMYRKEAALAVGGYNQAFWPADDVHLWFRLGRLGKLANIKQVLVHVRWHDEAASITYFRIDTVRTFKLHLWANEFVATAPFSVWLFWVCQFVAGMTLSPQFNWKAYRWIKRLIRKGETLQERFTKYLQPKTSAAKVTSHPKRLNLSGVYSR